MSQALACLVAALAALPAAAAAAESTTALEEVVVRASLLREQPLQAVPASVTVIDTETLRAAGEQHFEDVLALVPNLNWAGGTSRPRYFQIRGIGEREQYEGAPNPSVGFLIDDVDFCGIGMAGDAVRCLAGRGAARAAGHALRRERAGRASFRSAAPNPSRDAGLEPRSERGGLRHHLVRRRRDRARSSACRRRGASPCSNIGAMAFATTRS